jgi:hypothetical protein
LTSDERKEHAAPAQGYNGRDAVRLLRASVDATDDRAELRVIDSQLRQLLSKIREKIRGRRPAR